MIAHRAFLTKIFPVDLSKEAHASRYNVDQIKDPHWYYFSIILQWCMGGFEGDYVSEEASVPRTAVRPSAVEMAYLYPACFRGLLQDHLLFIRPRVYWTNYYLFVQGFTGPIQSTPVISIPKNYLFEQQLLASSWNDILPSIISDKDNSQLCHFWPANYFTEKDFYVKKKKLFFPAVNFSPQRLKVARENLFRFLLNT